MSSKMNWACDRCGMASGRKESVWRHINNPMIHRGKAGIVPFVHYLAGLGKGAYQWNNHNTFRPWTAHGFRIPDNQQANESFLDKIEKKSEEKMVDMIASQTVFSTFMSPPPYSPMSKINYPIQRSSFSYPGENISVYEVMYAKVAL